MRSLPMASSTPAHEVYQHGHHASVVTNHAKRTADKDAAFFLPLLRPGMRLLDVGCGPGSITAGVPQRGGPGATIGIRVPPGGVDTAPSLRHGSLRGPPVEGPGIYKSRFPPGSFDAAL